MLIHTTYPFPAPGLPPFGMGWAPLGGPVGRVREQVGRLIYRQVYERPLLPRFNAVRTTLGLEPLRRFDEYVRRVDRAQWVETEGHPGLVEGGSRGPRDPPIDQPAYLFAQLPSGPPIGAQPIPKGGRLGAGNG